MDLIERYLHAVKTHLPLKQQADVVAELAEDLRSRLDDCEAELGRPLDETEVVAVLKALGHPAHLAAGYGFAGSSRLARRCSRCTCTS